MIRVNLIPAARRDRQLARRRTRWWFRTLRVYAILLAVLGCLSFLPAGASIQSLEPAIARIERRIQSRTKELDTLRKESARLSRQLEVARAVGEHPDWSTLLLAIARARADLAQIESIDLALAKEEKKDKPNAPKSKLPARDMAILKLSGIAASPAACVQFAGALEALGVFEKVVVKDTRAHQLGRMSATHFEIEATLNASTTPPGAAQ